MMKKLMSRRGAVSVFLVIVLVPMITCASLFVDAGRIKSARGLVSSAGDLTLNTILSQYDVDLNDFYGLMASSQNIDDALTNAQDYFVACIKSQGIDTTNAAKYINSIKGFFLGDDDVSDLLGVNLAEDSSVSVEPLENGSLKNPALVKTQIVEFMKYRSPINSVLSLFEKFKQSSTELENSAKTTDLVDKKQGYYEAQGEVAKKAYEVYNNIMEYTKLNITKEELQEIKDLLNGLNGKYKDLHYKMVKDLFNTQGLTDSRIQKFTNIKINEYTHNKKNNNASAQQIKSQINSLLRACDQFVTARKNFENNVKQWQSSGNQYYDIQYWVHCCKNSSYFSNVVQKGNNLVNSYKSLCDMIDHAEEDVLSEKYTCTYSSTSLSTKKNVTSKTLREWYDYVKPDVTKIVSDVTKNSSRYNVTVDKVKNCVNVSDRINATATGKELAEIYNTLNDYETRYTQAEKYLEKIIKGLSELKNLVITADSKFETWENTANNYSSSGIEMAKADRNEIQEVKNDYKKISISDIDTYLNHVTNTKSAVGTVKNGILKIKYNGSSIVEKKINGFDAFKKHSSVISDDIPMYKAALEEYAASTFEFTMDGCEIQSLNYTDNNSPKLNDDKKYVVFKWMIEQGFDSPEDENKKSEYNSKKEECDKKAAEANETTLGDVASKNDITSLNNLPFGSSADLDSGKITTKINEVSTFVGKLFSNFGKTVSQAGVDLRDDLFVLDYITSMFTWQTYEYESKYNMLDTDQQRQITFNNADSFYSGKKDAWASTDATQKYNKTLTNKMRNSEATNWSYCNEVEYIMYGKGIEESKNSINGAIYMIRFALNLPVIFSTFYQEKGENSLNFFANGVQTASHGIIPAGLVKVIICLGLTALESARDLKTLRCGIPTILVKTKKDDLFVQRWDFLDTRDNPVTDKTSALTFSYSDYMKLILFIKLLGSEAYNIYGRIADVVQTNMSKCVLKDSEYTLTKSQVYYSIKADVTVKPLMLDTSYVKSFMPEASSRLTDRNRIEYSAVRGY